MRIEISVEHGAPVHLWRVGQGCSPPSQEMAGRGDLQQVVSLLLAPALRCDFSCLDCWRDCQKHHLGATPNAWKHLVVPKATSRLESNRRGAKTAEEKLKPRNTRKRTTDSFGGAEW